MVDALWQRSDRLSDAIGVQAPARGLNAWQGPRRSPRFSHYVCREHCRFARTAGGLATHMKARGRFPSRGGLAKPMTVNTTR